MSFKIIYLDDETHLCEMFAENFSSERISVETFTDPEAAIQAINQTLPDLVFLDYRLPHMTGEEVAARLKKSIPKAIVTGDIGITTLGSINRIFEKPFDFDAIQRFIQGFIDQRES